MKAECINQRTFELTDNERLVGTLIYPSIFSYDAEIELPNSDCYSIRSDGFFGTSVKVTKNNIELANLRMNWKGQIVITMHNGEEFLFRNTGVFYSKFVIENNETEKLVQFDPGLNWSKLNYNYTIETMKPQDSLFLLLGLYVSNYYVASTLGLV